MIINITVTGRVVVDLSREEVSLDVDTDELLRAMGGTEDVLDMLEYSEVMDYVLETEKERKEYEEEVEEARRGQY